MSHAVSMSHRLGRLGALLLAALWLAGCVVNDQRPMERIAAERATMEVPEDELLDVGVRLFDPGIPKAVEEDPAQAEKLRIYPEIRKAEARYVPMQARNTLEGTGQWGAVRVVPSTVEFTDVMVEGRTFDLDQIVERIFPNLFGSDNPAPR